MKDIKTKTIFQYKYDQSYYLTRRSNMFIVWFQNCLGFYVPKFRQIDNSKHDFSLSNYYFLNYL